MKLRTVMIIISIIMMSSVSGGIASLAIGGTPPSTTGASVTVVETGPTGSVVEFTSHGVTTGIAEGPGTGKMFDTITMNGCRNSGAVGAPALPEYRTLFALRKGAVPGVKVLDAEYETLDGLRLYPKLAESIVGEDPVFVIDEDAYSANEFSPVSVVDTEHNGILRDLAVTQLVFHPVQYNPVTREVRVYKRIKVLVTEDETKGFPYTPVRHSMSPDMEKIYKSLVCNYDNMNLPKEEIDQEAVKMLVISSPEYYDALSPLVEWHRQSGLPVEVVSIGEIGADQDMIKQYISDLYYSDGLEYVLLAGDIDLIPPYFGDAWTEHESNSDNWYSCVDPGDEDDRYPDLAISRITFRSEEELVNQVNKIVSYLTNPSMGYNWEERVLLVAHYQDRFTETSENIRLYDYALQDPEFITAYGGEGAGNDDVISAVNDGVGMVIYNGHGGADCWFHWGSQGSFTAEEVALFSNSGMYFPAFGMACSNSTFSYSEDTIAESFMKSQYGAISYYGSWNTTSGDLIDLIGPIVRAFFDEGITTIGYAKNFGEIEDNNASRFKQFFMLADPATDIWTMQPSPLDVHLPVITPFEWPIDVSVFMNGEPVEGARVRLSVEGEFGIYGFTGPDGVVTLTPPLSHPCTMKVVVTAHNGWPFIDYIDIDYPENAKLVLSDYELDDETGGNGNGLADYGEKISLVTTILNMGLETAHDVTGIASCSDGGVSFFQKSDTYGDVAFSDSVSGNSNYVFNVNPECIDMQQTTIDLELTDEEGTVWSQPFVLTLHAPILEIEGFTFSDSLYGLGNGIPEPGETIELFVELNNSGSGDAVGLTGILSSDDPYVNIVLDKVPFKYIPSGSCGMNSEGFLVEITPDCPENHRINFNLNMESDMGYHTDDEFFLYAGLFSDDMESGEGKWSSFEFTPGWGDEWHLSDSMNHGLEAGHVWKCGDTGDGDYSNSLDAALVTPSFYIYPGLTLEFWHRISAEVKEYLGIAGDGGIIEITTDDGESWEQLDPLTYYTHYIDYNNSSPFEYYTLCYSGHHNWKKAIVDLSAYEGEAKLMFRFGSDTLKTDKGWFIDDVRVTLTPVLDLRVIEAPMSAAPGTSVWWKIWVRNTGETVTEDFWLTADNGEGLVVDIPMHFGVEIEAEYMDVSRIVRNIGQSVSPGTYVITSKLGHYPDRVDAADSFTLQITP